MDWSFKVQSKAAKKGKHFKFSEFLKTGAQDWDSQAIQTQGRGENAFQIVLDRSRNQPESEFKRNNEHNGC